MIDMANVSPQLRRERIIRWDGPGALAKAGQMMSGRDFLGAILRGELPHPPACQLVDLTFNRNSLAARCGGLFPADRD